MVAYGLILPLAVLEGFALGAFNLHASLLPRWRGAAPIHRAIMAGDNETGVMVMKMDAGLTPVPLPWPSMYAIEPDATAGDLHDRLSRLGADLMVRALGAVERGSLTLTPQPREGVTYASKIEKDETRIEWARRGSRCTITFADYRHFPARGLNGRSRRRAPARRVKVLRSSQGRGLGRARHSYRPDLTVACGEGAVRILELQRAGRQSMTAAAFLRGSPVQPGARLG